MYNQYQYGQAMPYLPDFRPQQQQPAAPTTNVSWVYVNGMEGARAQIVQPGQTSWMMDNNDAIIYVKSVDGMGTAALKAFRLTEVNAPAAGGDTAEYVSKTEIEGIISRLEALEAKV